jgi:hypothetical protein
MCERNRERKRDRKIDSEKEKEREWKERESEKERLRGLRDLKGRSRLSSMYVDKRMRINNFTFSWFYTQTQKNCITNSKWIIKRRKIKFWLSKVFKNAFEEKLEINWGKVNLSSSVINWIYTLLENHLLGPS